MGADGRDRRIARACDYVIEHAQSAAGGFGISGSVSERPPPASAVYRCLNGNLLRVMIRFGRLDDARVRGSIDWEARSITGEGFEGYHRSGTTGPGFGCAVNDGNPCAWGADYPTGTRRSPSWFKLGFPFGYVADVLQNVETLAELGHARDPRLSNAIDLVLSKQDRAGRWRNQYPYSGKLWSDVDEPGAPSKWGDAPRLRGAQGRRVNINK